MNGRRSSNSSSSYKEQMSLSYLDTNLDRDGRVMSHEQIQDERIRQGYCTECERIPVRLYHIKKSRLMPLWETKIEITERGESLNGICLRCHPKLDPDRAKKKNRRSVNAECTISRNRASLSASTPVITGSQEGNEELLGHSVPNQMPTTLEDIENRESYPKTPGLVTSDTSDLDKSSSSSSSLSSSHENPDNCEAIYEFHQRKSSRRLVRQSSALDLNHATNTVPKKRSARSLVDNDSDNALDIAPLEAPRREQSATIPQPPIPHRETTNTVQFFEAKSSLGSEEEHETSGLTQPNNLKQPPEPSPQPSQHNQMLDDNPTEQEAYWSTQPNGLNPPTEPSPQLSQHDQIPNDNLSQQDILQLIKRIEALVEDIGDGGDRNLAIDILLQNLKNFSNNVKIQEFCLSKIWDLCKYDDEYKRSVASSSGPDDMLFSMKKHLHSPGVQERGCGALWCLCNDEERRMVVIRAGATARIVRALAENVYDVDMVGTCVGFLRTLSPEYEARETMGALSGIEHVCKAMNVHQDIASIQRDGCAFLSNCAVDMKKQQVALASIGELETIVNAIKTHRHDSSVLAGASFALKNYTFEERNVRRLTQVDGIFRLLEDVCQISIDEDTARHASVVLERIHHCKDIDNKIERLMLERTLSSMIADANVEPEKKVQQVIDLMDEYDWSCKVLAEVFGGLTLLCQYYPRQRMTVGSTKVIETVIAHMKTYKSFAQIQINSCELFTEVLKDADSLSTTFLDADVFEVIMEMMLDHKSDANVQIAATSVLKVLSKEIECWLTFLRSGFSIEEIMAAHPENQLIQDNGLEINTNLSLHGK